MSHTDEALGLTQPSQDTPVAVTVGTSPFAYKALNGGAAIVSGGTVTALSLTRNGVAIALGVTAGIVPISRDDVVTVTYSSLPTMTFIKR